MVWTGNYIPNLTNIKDHYLWNTLKKYKLTPKTNNLYFKKE